MLNLLVQTFVLTAITLLLVSYFPIWQIHKMLPACGTRRVWEALAGILTIFITGNVAFLWINYSEGPNHHEDWLISIIILGGSIFVLTACLLAEQTAREVSRISSLEKAASVDPVTDLYNRLHIMAILDLLCSQSSRDKTPVSVLLLDLDNFKQINDTYGHAAGDVVLRSIGQLILTNTSGQRYVGRFGGDEFLVVLPDIASSQAYSVAERIRSLVQNARMSYGSDPIPSPTVSIGAATGFGWREGSKDLVALADEALYDAKIKKNSVCHAFEPSGRKIATRLEISF